MDHGLTELFPCSFLILVLRLLLSALGFQSQTNISEKKQLSWELNSIFPKMLILTVFRLNQFMNVTFLFQCRLIRFCEKIPIPIRAWEP